MSTEKTNNDDEKAFSDIGSPTTLETQKLDTEKELPELPERRRKSKTLEANAPIFDFHGFLEQFKNAPTISRYTKSFISSFYGKNGLTLDQQIKLIQEFLSYCYVHMRECDVWKNMSEEEFDNAKEGMEKLLMNKLYPATFSSSLTDDKEKDDILQRKISIFGWIEEKHLDIPKAEENDAFLSFASSELLKMNNFKAPRDKLICILNCCKVIFGLMKYIKSDESADNFLPLLIYVIVKSNPPHLISNVHYIARFRDPERLRSESSYYLTNMMGAISFIENMDMHSLSITQEEFDRNIEQRLKELDKEYRNHHISNHQVKEEEEEEEEIVIGNENKQQQKETNQQEQEENHPFYKKLLLKKEPYLMDIGQEAIQKSFDFVGKLFSKQEEQEQPIEQRQIEAEQPIEQQQQQQPLIEQRPLPPRPVTHNEKQQQQQPPLPPRPMDFNDHLKTIENMFPNVEHDVCFMILQASNGNITQAIDSLLEMSNG